MRILITHGRGLTSVGLRQALERDGGFEIVAEAHGADATVAAVGVFAPDVVLLHALVAGDSALRLLRTLYADCPEVKVVMCGLPYEPELIQLALGSGACGCVLGTINPKDVAAAIRLAVDQTTYHARGLPVVGVDEAARLAGLTRREAQAVRAAARGLSNQEIADELCVTVRTVKSHLASVYRKLGVSNRTEAAGWALGARRPFQRRAEAVVMEQ